VSALSLLGLFALLVDESRVLAFVPLLTSLAAGALIGGAVFDLIPEAVARGAAPRAIIEGVAAGFVGFGVLENLLRRVASASPSRVERPAHPIVTLNFIGDALHNAADGAMIAAAFLASPAVGLVTTLAIVLHEVPRELGSFGVFLHGGVPIRRAVWYNALTGLTAWASAVLTLAIGSRVANAATIVLPIAAGTFFYVAVSIVPVVIGTAVSIPDRLRRIALAAAALLATAATTRLG
jgi:zinc and cadmium transporter